MTGIEYEKYCENYLRKMGYTDTYVTQASSDYGVDIIGYKFGEKTAIQCKYYSSPVGNKAIQEVYSGMAYYGCSKAVVITNSTFTKNAEEMASRLGVKLLSNVKPDTVGLEPDTYKSLQGEFPNYRYTDYAYEPVKEDYIYYRESVHEDTLEKTKQKKIINIFSTWLQVIIYILNFGLSFIAATFTLRFFSSLIADDMITFSLIPFCVIGIIYLALKMVSTYYILVASNKKEVHSNSAPLFLLLIYLAIGILVISVINSFVPHFDIMHLFLSILVSLTSLTALPNFLVLFSIYEAPEQKTTYERIPNDITDTNISDFSREDAKATDSSSSVKTNNQDVWAYAKMCTEEMNRKDKQERGQNM